MAEACPRQTVSLQTFMQVNNHAHEWSYCFPVDEAGPGPVPSCTGDGNVGNQHNRDFGQSERLMLRQRGGADCFCWSRLSSATLLHQSNKNQDKHPYSWQIPGRLKIKQATRNKQTNENIKANIFKMALKKCILRKGIICILWWSSALWYPEPVMKSFGHRLCRKGLNLALFAGRQQHH